MLRAGRLVTHIYIVRSNFLITASADGCVKFWKKTNDEGLVFVKLFRAHLGELLSLPISYAHLPVLNKYVFGDKSLTWNCASKYWAVVFLYRLKYGLY